MICTGLEAGAIHHIVVTAGASVAGGPLASVEISAIRKQFDAKYFVALIASKYGSEKLADGGSITLFSGALSRRPGRGSAALATANAANEALAKV